MPFICGGYPQAGDTARLLPALERGGAEIVEVGFPFSDPIADGPIIAAAMHEALRGGCTPERVFEEIRSVRARVGLGIVAMVSISIVHRMGEARFVSAARESGVDGFIFPDVPLEESERLVKLASEHGLTSSLLVAPSTTPERAARIVKACTGFIYLLARAGITGTGAAVPDIAPRVKMLRGMTDLPIACGFGISTPEHVRRIVHDGGADAAIVGSALVKHVSNVQAAKGDVVHAAEEFTRELTAGLGGGVAANR